MADANTSTNAVKARRFIRKGVLFSVASGTVLVKKSIFTGRIWSLGTYDEERKAVTDIREIRIHDPNVSRALLERARSRVSGRTAAIIDQELAFRDGNGTVSEELENATIKVKGAQRELIRRKIQAKTGIKIRWPWESALILSVKEQEISTPSIQIDTSERVRLTFDTDYRFKIIDPEVYATLFNSLAESIGGRAEAEISRRIGRELDQLVIDYVRNQGMDKFANKSSVDLIDSFSNQLFELGNRYGVEITRFFIKDIKLPQEMVDAEIKNRAAAKEAEARVKQAKGDADAKRLVNAAEAEKQGLVVAKMLEAINADPALASLPPAQKLETLKAMFMAQTSEKNVIIQGAGTPVHVEDVAAAAEAGVVGTPTEEAETTSAPSTPAADEEARAKELCETLGLLDDGYFLPRYTAMIAEIRGEEFKPGQVYHIDLVKPEEIFALADKIKAMDKQKKK